MFPLTTTELLTLYRFKWWLFKDRREQRHLKKEAFIKRKDRSKNKIKVVKEQRWMGGYISESKPTGTHMHVIKLSILWEL